MYVTRKYDKRELSKESLNWALFNTAIEFAFLAPTVLCLQTTITASNCEWNSGEYNL